MFPVYFAPADELEQKIFRFCWNCLKQQDCRFLFFFLKIINSGKICQKTFQLKSKRRGGEGKISKERER